MRYNTDSIAKIINAGEAVDGKKILISDTIALVVQFIWRSTAAMLRLNEL